MRCLRDKKRQNFAWLSSSRYCADRAQNLPGPVSDNVPRVLQISSNSVHFRQSYTRTREHHKNGPESVSNILRKTSFELNNNFDPHLALRRNENTRQHKRSLSVKSVKICCGRDR